MANERMSVLFSGRVQGVGFRYRTKQISNRHTVTGWVTNLTNGNVELLVEGQQLEIGRFIAEIQEQMSGFIRDTETKKMVATGEFSSFEIRH